MANRLRDAQGRFTKSSNGEAVASENGQALNEQLEVLANAVMTRSAFFQQSLDPRRSIADECGYPRTTAQIKPSDYRFLYDREPVATRVVQVMPNQTWQSHPEVFEDEDPETETEFEGAWKELDKMLRGSSWYQDVEGSPIWEQLHRADTLSGIGHYGVLLLGLDDGRELREPAEGIDEFGKQVGKQSGRQLLYMRSFDETLAQITRYEQNRANPRKGQPIAYNLTLSDPREQSLGSTNPDTSTVTVHWTRVIHLADNLGSSEVLGVPRQRPVYNRLLDLYKLYGGSAEMYWKGAFFGLAFEDDVQFGGNVKHDVAKNRAAMEQYFNGLQRALQIPGTKIKTLAPQVVNPTPQIDAQLQAICIQLEIPKRKFTGSERGELASSQDDSDWNDVIRGRQNGNVTPKIIVPFVDRLIMLGVLPEPEGYSVVWPDLEALNEAERATIAVQQTEALAKYVLGSVEALVPPAEFLTQVLGWPSERVESILQSAIGAVGSAMLTIPEEEPEEVPAITGG